MALYAIGDVHGCYDRLRQLLDTFAFDPSVDELWFVGDLVNRGDNSLEVLRFIKSLGDTASCVLGNHDFHLMRFALGLSETKDAGLRALLAAADRNELLEWLYRRPLLKVDQRRELIMVHAGLLPQWDIPTAQRLSDEVSASLSGADSRRPFFETLYGDQPDCWSDALEGMERLRIAVNAMTRMRYLNEETMAMDLSCTEAPGKQPAKLLPWHTFPHCRDKNYKVVSGHWASQGFRHTDGYIALDSACIWGGQLSAMRLDEGREELFQVECG